MYAEPGKGAIHGAKDLRHGDVYLRLGLMAEAPSTSEARRLAVDNLLSFLHVSRAEIGPRHGPHSRERRVPHGLERLERYCQIEPVTDRMVQ